MINITPLHDKVIVRRLEAKEKSSGGIILPETAKEKPMQGEVLAVGKGAMKDDGTLIPMTIKVGDRVLFGKWAGTEFNLDGDEVLVINEKDIIGIIK